MLYRRCRNALALFTVFAGSAPAIAYDWGIVARVTTIEVTYMPVSIDFKVDQAGGSCAVGTLLTWTPQGADPASKAQNAQAVLAALMTAEAAGRTITIYGNNTGCIVTYAYLN